MPKELCTYGEKLEYVRQKKERERKEDKIRKRKRKKKEKESEEASFGLGDSSWWVPMTARVRGMLECTTVYFTRGCTSQGGS